MRSMIGAWVLTACWAGGTAAAEPGLGAHDEAGFQTAEISGDPVRPRRHFRVPNAARLTRDEAERIYRDIGEDLADGYALSGHPTARE